METENFIKLLKQINKGKIQALLPIYYEYYEKMKLSALRILHNEADAQDAASNVILKIITYAKNNKNPTVEYAGAYINTSIRNAAMDVYNANHKTINFEFAVELDTSSLSENTIIDYVVLGQALAELPDLEFQITTMFYFYDYKIKQIADELNLAVGTVKWKLSEVRNKIIKYFQKN